MIIDDRDLAVSLLGLAPRPPAPAAEPPRPTASSDLILLDAPPAGSADRTATAAGANEHALPEQGD
jgi:hypothetical protein